MYKHYFQIKIFIRVDDVLQDSPFKITILANDVFFTKFFLLEKKKIFILEENSHIFCRVVFNFSMLWVFFLISPLNQFVIWNGEEIKKAKWDKPRNFCNNGLISIFLF